MPNSEPGGAGLGGGRRRISPQYPVPGLNTARGRAHQEPRRRTARDLRITNPRPEVNDLLGGSGGPAGAFQCLRRWTITVMKRVRMPATVKKSAEPMNKAATRLRSGVGGVIPKVRMKASAMDSRNFTGVPILF